MTDEDVLRMEHENRTMRGSVEAETWKRAQFAFELWRRKTKATSNPTAWVNLPGLERAIWHEIIVLLDATSPAAEKLGLESYEPGTGR